MDAVLSVMILPMMIGTSELLLIGALVPLLFGARKLPEMLRGLGRGVRGLKDGMKEGSKAENSEEDEKTSADDKQ